MPLNVITDRGSQFEAELFQELSSLIGFHRLRTTAYHPQTNGMVERMHRTLKTAIMARKKSWLISLPIVLLGIRAAVNESQFSPFTALTGSNVLLPSLLINESSQSSNFSSETVRELAVEMNRIDFNQFSSGHHHAKTNSYVPKDLRNCSHVWLRIDRIRRPLEAPYSGPYKVIKRNDKYFTIELTCGRQNTVSINRLKPAILPQEPIQRHSSQPDPQSSTSQNDNIVTPEESPDNEEYTPVKEQSVVEPTSTRSGRRVKFNPKNDFHYF